MGFLLDLAVIIGIVYVIAYTASSGLLSYPGAALALTGVFVVGVVLRGRARTTGGPLRMLFTLGMPVLSLYLILLQQPQGARPLILGSLSALFLVVVGLYIALFGAFSSPRGLVWNLPALLSIVVFVVGLTVRGYIAAEIAGLFILALVTVRGLGQQFGPRVAKTTRATYSLLLPLASLVILALVTMSLDGGIPMVGGISSLLTLGVLALVLYFAVRMFAGR